MNDALTFEAQSESETVALGAALAAALPANAVVALYGILGAGKTRFVQAAAAALGVEPREVVSPTFVLVQEYQGRMPVYHFDAYRLGGNDEFRDLGADDYFASPGVSFVEWADRVEEGLPAERL